MRTTGIGGDFIAVRPAYGRSYKSEEAARKDWLADKDFRTIAGPYVNRADVIQHGTHAGIVLEIAGRCVYLPV